MSYLDIAGHMLYVNKHVGPQDYKTAIKWLTLAAEQGEADAQFHLGMMYVEGRGVPDNPKEAQKWFLNGTGDLEKDMRCLTPRKYFPSMM